MEMCVLQIKDKDIRHLALASLGINIDNETKLRCLRELEALSQNEWYRCEFRNCDLLLVYGGDNVLEKSQISWTTSAQKCPTLQKLVETIIQPYFYTKPRIIVLKTKQKEELNWHVDCNREELDGFQPKLRCLISGRHEDLYYLSKNGSDKIYAPIRSDIYYMSGAYIHSLKNESASERYVLCFGSPWTEADIKPEFLKKLSQLHDSHLLWSDNLLLANRENYVRNSSLHGLNQYGTP
jgi:hypothetical protein